MFDRYNYSNKAAKNNNTTQTTFTTTTPVEKKKLLSRYEDCGSQRCEVEIDDDDCRNDDDTRNDKAVVGRLSKNSNDLRKISVVNVKNNFSAPKKEMKVFNNRCNCDEDICVCCDKEAVLLRKDLIRNESDSKPKSTDKCNTNRNRRTRFELRAEKEFGSSSPKAKVKPVEDAPSKPAREFANKTVDKMNDSLSWLTAEEVEFICDNDMSEPKVTQAETIGNSAVPSMKIVEDKKQKDAHFKTTQFPEDYDIESKTISSKNKYRLASTSSKIDDLPSSKTCGFLEDNFGSDDNLPDSINESPIIKSKAVVGVRPKVRERKSAKIKSHRHKNSPHPSPLRFESTNDTSICNKNVSSNLRCGKNSSKLDNLKDESDNKVKHSEQRCKSALGSNRDEKEEFGPLEAGTSKSLSRVNDKKSFKLSSTLEVTNAKDTPRKKNVNELIACFKNDTALMRKPCREFLDSSLFQEAKIEHHVTLVKTLLVKKACGSSCLLSSASSLRTVNEQSTFDLQDNATPDTARRRKARKVLNFDTPDSACRIKIGSSTPKTDGNTFALKCDQLFSIEQFSDVEEARGPTPPKCLGASSGEHKMERKLDKVYISEERSKKKSTAIRELQFNASLAEVNSNDELNGVSPRKSGISPRKNSSGISMDNEWACSEDNSERKDNSFNSNRHSTNSCKVSNECVRSKSYMKKDQHLNNSFSMRDEDDHPLIDLNGYHTPKKSKATEFGKGSPGNNANTSVAILDDFHEFEGKENSPRNSTPRKSNASYSKFDKTVNECNNDNDVPHYNDDMDESRGFCNGGYQDSPKRNTSSTSSTYRKNRSFSAKNTSQTDEYPPLDEGDYPVIDECSRFEEDVGDAIDNRSYVSNKSFSARKVSNSDNYSKNSSLKFDDEPPRFDNDSDPIMNSSPSRMNNSASSENSKNRGSPVFTRNRFSSLNGHSPIFKRKSNGSSFKFEEDPRFNSSHDSNFYNNGDCLSNASSSHFEVKDDTQAGSSRNRRRSSSNSTSAAATLFLNNNEPAGCSGLSRLRRKTTVVNDSHDFDPDDNDVFGLSGSRANNDDDMELDDDLFTSDSHHNGNHENDTKDTNEGRTFKLNNLVKVSKKGVSFGAMGCELKIGRNVELNLFGKKVSTLV